MLFRHSMSITQQLIPIYNTTVHKNNKTINDFNVAKLLVICRHQHARRAKKNSNRFQQLKILIS